MDVPKELFMKYKNWIIKNPLSASELETFMKLGSYVLAGRLKNSSVMCELVYSSSRLFELFNDYILSGSLPNLSLSSQDITKCKISLTVLGYLEVLIEVGSHQIWGEKVKRFIVMLIQLLKAIWRFYLLTICKVRTISDPPIRPVNRKELKSSSHNEQQQFFNGFDHMNQKEGFQKLRSGRVLRRMGSTPSPHLRTYSPPRIMGVGTKPLPLVLLTTKELIAEALHIMKPLTHLSSLMIFGERSWVPYGLALSMDLTSIKLKHDYILTKDEEMEMIRRRMSLLYYLVRTPAFQAVTHKEISNFLMTVGHYIPGAKYLCVPLLEYIPHWQGIYSYTWS